MASTPAPLVSAAPQLEPGSPSLSSRRANRHWPRLPGISAAMGRIEESIDRAAQFDCPVLLTGETGCGKEEVARAIHAASPRAGKPFLTVNCGGLVSTLAESQLFGHEKGAFTGAFGPSLGAFRAADGGVVFLDEIGEMPIDLQPKLLHVVQRLEVTPVGSSQSQHVDVQVIAATNRDLEAAVATGQFREDLFYRLNTIHIAVPPLRERREDIPLFIRHFVSHFARLYGRPYWRPEPQVLERLIAHSWPGNVRQLAQTIQRMYVFEGREETVLSDLFRTEAAQGDITGVSLGAVVGGENLGETGTVDDAALLGAEPAVPLLNLGELRRLAVRQAMRVTKGHRGRAAELLGVSLNTMTRLVAESCPEVPATKVGRKRTVRPR
ncbi:MAG: sigma-54 dependent transcriptional regulator [Planctomycetia bacterium]